MSDLFTPLVEQARQRLLDAGWVPDPETGPPAARGPLVWTSPGGARLIESEALAWLENKEKHDATVE